MDPSATPAADAVPRLTLRLLGELELRRADGSVLALPPSRRTRALLGYLVATGVPQLRSSLCDLLWDGPDDPRAALRWSLTKLRPVVDDEATQRLRADRDKVAFEPHACTIDSARVAALRLDADALQRLPIETLEDAAGLLCGEFLDGLELPACYRFHHWCMAERERHARLRRATLEALTTRLADAPQRALPHGRAMVAADPLAEAAHATLVRLLAAAGRYPEAEKHYAWARELLRREVALPDGGALDAAIRLVRRQQREALAASAAAPVVAPEPRPSIVAAVAPAPAALVGRAAECAAIDAALDALSGPPQDASYPAPLLLVVGEPGIGKTRLLDHLAERAAARGNRVIRARCFEAEAVRPYGYWLDALHGMPAAASREQLFDATAESLAQTARQAPLVLIVDDLQWIDEASAALLHFVSRRLAEAALPALFAAAARAGEVEANSGANAGARSLLQSFARERALVRLAPQALDADAVRGWLGARLPDIDAALRASGGNPLFLAELARSGGSDAPSLDALIEARLAALDDPSRDLLGWASAFGGAFGAERLAAATALPVADVLARIAPCERRGLLRASAGDGHADADYDFAHGLVRQAVYRALATPRRRAVHRQLARVFDAASAGDPWLHGAVLHHASLAGDALLAARAALAAGTHWLQMFANADAAQVAERGLMLLESLADSPERARLEIGLLRLRVAAAAAPGGRRLPALAPRIEQAIEAAERHALHAEASAGWEILAFWRQHAGDAPGAQQATLAAERSTRRADAITRCQQLANSGRCLVEIEADMERGRSLLAEAASLAAELELPVMELEWGRGLLARIDGDRPAARAALEQAIALAHRAGNHWREYECRLALATVDYELGRFDDVLGHVDAIGAAARRMGEAQVPFADALAALVRQRRGEPEAGAAVAASLAALGERDAKAQLAYALNETAALALIAGDRDAARRHAEAALAAATAVRRSSAITRAQETLAALAAPDGRPSSPERRAP